MEQKQTHLKTFGQRFRLFKEIQPVYLEWTADNRIIMKALNPATSVYNITLFEVAPSEVTRVSYFISIITLRVNGVMYRVTLGDPISGRGISYGPLVFIPEARQARKLSGIDVWKTLFKQAGVKVQHAYLNPVGILALVGIFILITVYFTLTIWNR